jgi:hypothetical protein
MPLKDDVESCKEPSGIILKSVHHHKIRHHTSQTVIPSDLEIGSHMPVRGMFLIRCLSFVVTNVESDTLKLRIASRIKCR